MNERSYARKYLRISPEIPMHAQIAIVQVGIRQVASGTARVRILDVSPGGLKFMSSLSLPAEKSIQLELYFRVMDQDFRLKGHIIYRTSTEASRYEYGFQFNEADGILRVCLRKLFNNMSVKMRRHIVILRLN